MEKAHCIFNNSQIHCPEFVDVAITTCQVRYAAAGILTLKLYASEANVLLIAPPRLWCQVCYRNTNRD